MLFVEATAMPGEGFVLTGQLGDVMKESAQIALGVCLQADRLGIEQSAFERKFHVHVPAGRFEGRPERRHHDGDRPRVAARPTGEAHRRDDRRADAAGPGAADRRAQAEGPRRHAAGLTDVVIPERNRADLDDDVPERVREELRFHLP